MSLFNRKKEQERRQAEAQRAAEKAEREKTEQAYAKADRKFTRNLILVCATIFVVFVGGMWYFGVNSARWDEEARQANLQAMTEQTGIVNGEEYDLVVGSSLNEHLEFKGSVFLFAGSITGETQEKLRLGYTAPNGDSYILSVPVDKVKFHQVESTDQSARFQFNDWRPGKNLQGNIDAWYFEGITIELRPEEFTALIG